MPSNLKVYDEPGHVHFWTISCFRRLGFFFTDRVKEVVVEGLHLLQKEFRVCLIGYVVMPNHVHVLLYPHAAGEDTPLSISKLRGAFKQFTGYYGKERLREYWRVRRSLWSDSLNRWAHGEYGDRTIWNARGYDFNIDRLETLTTKLEYCHMNPVKRELVNHPDEWRWSSYRYYEYGDDSVLAMDWKREWPIVW